MSFARKACILTTYVHFLLMTARVEPRRLKSQVLHARSTNTWTCRQSFSRCNNNLQLLEKGLSDCGEEKDSRSHVRRACSRLLVRAAVSARQKADPNTDCEGQSLGDSNCLEKSVGSLLDFVLLHRLALMRGCRFDHSMDFEMRDADTPHRRATVLSGSFGRASLNQRGRESFLP